MARCVRDSLRLGFQGLFYKPEIKRNTISGARIIACAGRYCLRLFRLNRTAASCMPSARHIRALASARLRQSNCLRAITSMRIGSRRLAISSFNSEFSAAARLLRFQVFQRKTQINTAKVLKNVKQEKHRHHSARRGLEQISLLRRLHVPHQPRIIDTLYVRNSRIATVFCFLMSAPW